MTRTSVPTRDPCPGPASSRAGCRERRRPQSITTGSLIREMVDLRRLAEFPEPSYRTVQFSSYDRRSRFPSRARLVCQLPTGSAESPSPDFEEVLREPDADGIGVYLICDVEGPGAVVRLWTARIGGALRVFLDGSRETLYDGPAEAFFQKHLRGPGLLRRQRACSTSTYSQAEAGYYPIPFAKRLRMEWDGDLEELHFYQVQVRLYEPGARVTSFRTEDLSRYESDIADVARILAHPGKTWIYVSSRTPVEIVATIPPGETGGAPGPRGTGRHRAPHAEGPGGGSRRGAAPGPSAHRLRRVATRPGAGPPGGLLRGGAGDQPLRFRSLHRANADGTMTCRFWMPFQRSARITVENRGARPLHRHRVGPARGARVEGRPVLHFRARWRVDHESGGFRRSSPRTSRTSSPAAGGSSSARRPWS